MSELTEAQRAAIAGIATLTQWDGSTTKASSASLTWDGLSALPATLTITGVTAITTATGVNLFNISAPAIVFANTVADAATLYIGGPPTISGGGAITRAYSLWIDSGALRLDGGVVAFGGNPAPVFESSTNNALGGGTQAAWIPINSNGTRYWVPAWT